MSYKPHACDSCSSMCGKKKSSSSSGGHKQSSCKVRATHYTRPQDFCDSCLYRPPKIPKCSGFDFSDSSDDEGDCYYNLIPLQSTMRREQQQRSTESETQPLLIPQPQPSPPTTTIQIQNEDMCCKICMENKITNALIPCGSTGTYSHFGDDTLFVLVASTH